MCVQYLDSLAGRETTYHYFDTFALGNDGQLLHVLSQQFGQASTFL